jgi:hypothetical protein
MQSHNLPPSWFYHRTLATDGACPVTGDDAEIPHASAPSSGSNPDIWLAPMAHERSSGRGLFKDIWVRCTSCPFPATGYNYPL